MTNAMNSKASETETLTRRYVNYCHAAVRYEPVKYDPATDPDLQPCKCVDANACPHT